MGPLSCRTAPGLLSLVLLLGTEGARGAEHDDAPTARLPELQVTARKREESLQRVPSAVSAFSAEALDRLDIKDLADLDGQVPNLSASAGRGSRGTLTTYLRGIGQSDQLWGVDPGVGIYLDDVYLARAQGALLALHDVERVEVLRGPQGTLYGKNTPGGAIKYVSAPLEPERYGQLQTRLGNYGRADLLAALNTPVGSGGWAARFSVASFSADGYGRNRRSSEPVSDEEVLAARASLGWSDGEQRWLRLSVDALDDQSAPAGARMLQSNRFAPEQPPLRHDFDTRAGMRNLNDQQTEGASLSLGWTAGCDWSAKSITALRQGRSAINTDADTLPTALADLSAVLDDRQRSQELQFNYDGGGRLRGVLGAFAFFGDAGGELRTRLLERTFQSFRGRTHSRNLAAYADGSFDLDARWSLSAGLRHTSERKRARVLNRCFADASFLSLAARCSASNPTPIAADFDDEKDFHDLTPRLSLDWRRDDDTLHYLQFAQGFKSGGFNIRAQTVPFPASRQPFEDEHVSSLELGSKLSLWQGRAQINLALFHTRYRDIQLLVLTGFDSDGDGVNDATFGDFRNAGRGRIHGLEIEYRLALDRRHRLYGHLAWLDSAYDEYLTAAADGSVRDIADQQRFTNAPEYSAALNLERDWNAPLGHVIRSRVSYQWQSELDPTTDLSPFIRQPAYGLLSARLDWDWPGPWSLALEGRNLTDRRYRTSGFFIDAADVVVGYYGDPRSFALSLRYDY